MQARSGLSLLLLQIGLAAILALSVTAEGHAQSRAESALIVGSEGAIPPLDPHRLTGTVGLRIIDALFDPLVREDLSRATDGAPDLTPGAAASWAASDDGKTYTFQIRKDAMFHDGTSLDAAAVQNNFDRLMDPSSPLYDERASGNMEFLTRWIASTRAAEDGTFAIELKEPFAGLPRLLTDRRMSIVSPKALQEYPGDELAAHPVGTGPYMLDTFERGQQLEVTRNEDYWGGTPNLERIIFRPITDPTSMAIAMQTGEIDLIPSASAEQVKQLEALPGVTVQYPEPANQYFLRLNLRVASTNDVEFRRALNYAVNRDGIAALTGGQAAPLYGPIPRGNEVYEEGVAAPYAYDPEKAKELIAESGVSAPVTVDLMAPNSGPGFGLAPQVVSLLQQDLKEVGVTLEPQFLEFATLISTERGGYADDVNGSYNGWTTGADSAYWLERMFSGAQQPPSGVNRGWYENEQVDQLFEQARGEVDEEQRTALYQEAAELIAADAPWVFLYQDRLPRILSERVTGIVPAGSVYIDYAAADVR